MYTLYYQYQYNAMRDKMQGGFLPLLGRTGDGQGTGSAFRHFIKNLEFQSGKAGICGGDFGLD